MADVFDLYVKDNRTIQFNLTEPIMLEDSHVSDWVFHIPRVLNNIDMSGWAWWLVYINARGQKYSELLELSEDPESPLEKYIATYSVDYGMSIKAGIVRFSLEAINTDTGGEILNEWHTQTYQAKVQDTLQGNQVEFAETESDIISALIIEVQNKVSQLVGGATPEPKNLIADMTDTKKVYLYVGEETGESTNYWYYYNGSAWVAGGLYASGVTVDSTPTQGSTNAVSSGGVYSALQTVESEIPVIDLDLTQSGRFPDSKVVGDEISDLKEDLIDLGLVAYITGSDWDALQNGRIDKTSAAVISDNSYKYTDLYTLHKGDLVEIAVYSAPSNLGIVVYSDSAQTTVIYSKYGCRLTAPITFVANSTCYVRLSCSKEYLTGAYVHIVSGVVREYYNSLFDKINTLTTDFSEITWSDGYINYSTGAKSTITNGVCTDYIKVAKGEIVILKNYYLTSISDSRGIAFYDENKVYQSGLQMTGADMQITVPCDGYMRFSAFIDTYRSMIFAVDFSALVSSINRKVDIDGVDQVSKANAQFYNYTSASNNILSVPDGIYKDTANTWQVKASDNVFTVTRLAHLSSDVNVPIFFSFVPTANANYSMSEYCDALNVDTDWDMPVILAVFEDGVLLKYIGIGSGNNGAQKTFDVVAGKTYTVGVRVGQRTAANLFFDAGNTITFVANLQLTANATSVYEVPSMQYIKDVYDLLGKVKGLNGDVSTALNPLASKAINGGLTNIFPKIACIGDSLTKGGMTLPDTPSTIIDLDLYSYPSQLARLLGNTVYNMGLSGATATTDGKHSWNAYADTQGYFSSQYKAQAYIIALGVNDNSYNGSFNGDISTDIDTSDYTNNADTSVGGYARVIQRIKELVPDAIIFCVTIPNTQSGPVQRANANTKIKAIADMFDCFVIDLATYGVKSIYVTTWKSTYYCNTHPNAMGYRWVAETFATYINWIIQNNPADFYLVPAIT